MSDRFKEYTDFIIHELEIGLDGKPCWQHEGENWWTCYGIAQRWNQDLTFPIGLSTAIQRYYEKYWVASGAEEIEDPATALVHYDCWVNQGGKIATKIREISEDMDYVTYMFFRLAEYHDVRNRRLPDGKPDLAAYQRWERNIVGWSMRLIRIQEWINNRLLLGGLDDESVDRFFLCDRHSCIELPFEKARIINGKLYVRTEKTDDEMVSEQVDTEVTPE